MSDAPAEQPADEKKYPLRLPPALYDKIVEEAKAHRRSINSEMLFLFEEALAAREKAEG